MTLHDFETGAERAERSFLTIDDLLQPAIEFELSDFGADLPAFESDDDLPDLH